MSLEEANEERLATFRALRERFAKVSKVEPAVPTERIRQTLHVALGYIDFLKRQASFSDVSNGYVKEVQAALVELREWCEIAEGAYHEAKTGDYKHACYFCGNTERKELSKPQLPHAAVCLDRSVCIMRVTEKIA